MPRSVASAQAHNLNNAVLELLDGVAWGRQVAMAVRTGAMVPAILGSCTSQSSWKLSYRSGRRLRISAIAAVRGAALDHQRGDRHCKSGCAGLVLINTRGVRADTVFRNDALAGNLA